MDGLNEMGFPINQSRHFDNDGYYEAETIQDHSLAAVEQFQKDNKVSSPGERVVVRYTRPPGKPLATFPADTKTNNQGNQPCKRDKNAEAVQE
ncbi:hypothetical protein [Arthrobacter sp. 260]|uniref:hypothetical protein n=1 Tax=Arthrobacter sp. 260 TaxID=2735314 RepID=UPI001491DC94|nr:hypothetical protein [Arthrobacter sp. 260]NOJ59761.1 hypothetical protein [Arthrobacter sp. 260]